MDIRKEFPSINIEEFEKFCQIEDEQLEALDKTTGATKIAHGCTDYRRNS